MGLLLVEDDRQLVALLLRLFVGTGYRTDVAHDGQSGLHRGLTRSYGVTVLDRGLPVVDGLGRKSLQHRNPEVSRRSARVSSLGWGLLGRPEVVGDGLPAVDGRAVYPGRGGIVADGRKQARDTATAAIQRPESDTEVPRCGATATIARVLGDGQRLGTDDAS